MSDLHHFVIEGTDNGISTKITLDGVELRGVTFLMFTADPLEANRLRLEFIPGSVKIDAHGRLFVQGKER